MINEIAIVVLAGVVGLNITLIYIFTGIFIGTLGGYLLEKLGFEKYLQDYLFKIKNTSSGCSCCSSNIDEKIIDRIKNSLIYVKDLFKKIFLFVLIGVGVGAFLHGYVPQEFFIKYMGKDNLFAVPLAVLCGIPLYSDATTIILVAQVLIEKGSSIGTVLIFMMAIVGLSLPELIILSRVMKRELIIRYVIFMAITFILVGYFYNFIF